MSMGADTKARGGGALQRGHGAPLEPLAQLGDALRSVGAVAFEVEAAELVVDQTARGKEVVSSMGVDKKANTLGAGAHLRLVIFVSLRTAASAMAPWLPMLLFQRLQGMGGGSV